MDISFLAVSVAVVADMMLGALWYSPVLFGKTWMKAVGIEKPEDLGDSAKPAYATSALSAVALALFFSWLFGALKIESTGGAIGVALAVWLGVIATVILPPYFWENRPKIPYVIYSGFKLVSVTLMAVILTML